MNGEFYIGWQDEASARTATNMRRSIIVLLGIAMAVAGILASSQRLIGNSVFEWGKLTEFSGVLNAGPVPHLAVAHGGTSRFYYLVRPWKFGFDPQVAARFDRQPVTLRGALIHRDNQMMIEVLPGSVTRNSAAPRLQEASAGIVSLGEQTFVGEIVDSKCFLGVMNPGQLKPHRACAVRCISGGVPPVLLVRETAGAVNYLLLVSADGKPMNKEVLGFVAEPVRISGQLVRQGEMLMLRADPASIQRL